MYDPINHVNIIYIIMKTTLRLEEVGHMHVVTSIMTSKKNAAYFREVSKLYSKKWLGWEPATNFNNLTWLSYNFRSCIDANTFFVLLYWTASNYWCIQGVTIRLVAICMYTFSTNKSTDGNAIKWWGKCMVPVFNCFWKKECRIMLVLFNNVEDDKIWLIELRMLDCNSLEFLILIMLCKSLDICLLDASECHWRLTRIDETLIPFASHNYILPCCPTLYHL